MLNKKSRYSIPVKKKKGIIISVILFLAIAYEATAQMQDSSVSYAKVQSVSNGEKTSEKISTGYIPMEFAQSDTLAPGSAGNSIGKRDTNARLVSESKPAVPAFGKVKKPTLGIEGSTIISGGDHVPFWLVSNKYGVYSTQHNQFVARINAIALPDSGKKIDYYYGVDGSLITDKSTRLVPLQAYIGVKLYDFNLYGGIKNEYMGTQDSALSMGGFLYSGNARSYPRIAFRTNDYIYVPFTNHWVETKFGISHGWMGNDMQYVKNAYLHDKYFYAKFKITRTLKVYAGLHHIAMWGGTIKDSVSEKLPSDMKAFWEVFFISRGDEGPESTIGHRLGDHIASYHFGADFSNEKLTVNFYWQTMLEDKNGRVGIDWKNSSDGLWGLAFTNKEQGGTVKKIVVEYFNSTNQSGDLTKSGGDNYYNHWLYRSGWTNFGMVNGSPVITSPAFYNMDPISMVNNRVRAFHIGAAAQFGKVYVLGKATYTLNYGTNNYPSTVHTRQVYSCLDVHYTPEKLKKTEFVGSLGVDYGGWLGKNYGVQITYRKFFTF